MITLPNITQVLTTTPHHELPWNHVNKLMIIQVFPSQWAARGYISLQGWTGRDAKVRMCKMPGHKYANASGNVVIIRFGEKEPVGGWLYLFTHGEKLELWAHGEPK